MLHQACTYTSPLIEGIGLSFSCLATTCMYIIMQCGRFFLSQAVHKEAAFGSPPPSGPNNCTYILTMNPLSLGAEYFARLVHS